MSIRNIFYRRNNPTLAMIHFQSDSSKSVTIVINGENHESFPSFTFNRLSTKLEIIHRYTVSLENRSSNQTVVQTAHAGFST